MDYLTWMFLELKPNQKIINYSTPAKSLSLIIAQPMDKSFLFSHQKASLQCKVPALILMVTTSKNAIHNFEKFLEFSHLFFFVIFFRPLGYKLLVCSHDIFVLHDFNLWIDSFLLFWREDSRWHWTCKAIVFTKQTLFFSQTFCCFCFWKLEDEKNSSEEGQGHDSFDLPFKVQRKTTIWKKKSNRISKTDKIHISTNIIYLFEEKKMKSKQSSIFSLNSSFISPIHLPVQANISLFEVYSHIIDTHFHHHRHLLHAEIV